MIGLIKFNLILYYLVLIALFTKPNLTRFISLFKFYFSKIYYQFPFIIIYLIIQNNLIIIICFYF